MLRREPIDLQFPTIHRRKFRSQISHLWTDAATVVRAVREEKESDEKESTDR